MQPLAFRLATAVHTRTGYPDGTAKLAGMYENYEASWLSEDSIDAMQHELMWSAAKKGQLSAMDLCHWSERRNLRDAVSQMFAGAVGQADGPGRGQDGWRPNAGISRLLPVVRVNGPDGVMLKLLRGASVGGYCRLMCCSVQDAD